MSCNLCILVERINHQETRVAEVVSFLPAVQALRAGVHKLGLHFNYQRPCTSGTKRLLLGDPDSKEQPRGLETEEEAIMDHKAGTSFEATRRWKGQQWGRHRPQGHQEVMTRPAPASMPPEGGRSDNKTGTGFEATRRWRRGDNRRQVRVPGG